MMRWIALFPVLIPFGTALLLLLYRSNSKWQRGMSLVSQSVLLLVAFKLLSVVQTQGIQVIQLGNWKAPFGIVFAVDSLGAVMVLISAVVGFTSVLFAFHDIGPKRRDGAFYSLFHFLLFGINGAFSTGDIFNLFVFFEVVLMTSYVLLTLGNEPDQVKSGFSYLTLNLIGSTLFLAGAGILFGLVGSLNMAHIAERIEMVPNKGLVTLVAMIFLFVFGLKSAMFPLNNWLPDSYIAPPTPVSAIFAGLLTKVGVYSMYRVFGTVFTHEVSLTHHTLLLPLAALTMVIGVWGAVVQTDVRSILAYHSISQVGYILLGLGLFTPLGLAGGIFHMIHHSLVKSSLFLIGGAMSYVSGSQNLKKISGLLKISTGLAVLFILSALALAGVPPLSGFFSKFALILSSSMENRFLMVFAALFTSLFTLYSMVKIWRLGFWGSLQVEETKEHRKANFNKALITSCVSVLFVLALGIFAKPMMNICLSAGKSLLNQDQYISTVLSTVPVPQQGRLDLAKGTQ